MVNQGVLIVQGVDVVEEEEAVEEGAVEVEAVEEGAVEVEVVEKDEAVEVEEDVVVDVAEVHHLYLYLHLLQY